MDKQIIPYKFSIKSKREQIQNMFTIISTRYDLLNRIISWGLDKRWRNKVFKLVLQRNPDSVLDIATGTADMAILLSKTKARHILAIDTSVGMLAVAREKINALGLQRQIRIEIQDAENIKCPDNFFDAATITYGIRNFENLERSLSEAFRVLKSNGILVILETSVPSNPLIRLGYKLYTKKIVPKIGAMISKDKNAYEYLAESAINFQSGSEIVAILRKIGYQTVKSLPQVFGISTIYVAEKCS
ncbi:bifunctional demethylmenaquinone methyltransferase/2-methoxy-6-polyprenyl-1,4-benzoquinol methylase UbiE [Dyadobacter aurulentus]|uniref:bifunctional demethylmenaquinone methyltransferase/2-methoxy-6-polyprenyl-1,4-benzoquinol methylase UbiE n=1 Tax=Dyadobacter sp. UC 10 TaxID=2605428 RepID=UPI0011F0BBC4|nr:bifunctional demethylmenaquinone methyltransferase/2-methoxy-6-polyprenyl-1,4-benzoquinol methylase UbiE [Dyadobacter sp. UC 10]KAA0993364.1 bifunctional demethylmenaquinone methyltransferase/2-methoxy-6-polyprenyl-1,4-benzoquinol methylase UbiE [Dyadobacter sp. UC 10]